MPSTHFSTVTIQLFIILVVSFAYLAAASPSHGHPFYKRHHAHAEIASVSLKQYHATPTQSRDPNVKRRSLDRRTVSSHPSATPSKHFEAMLAAPTLRYEPSFPVKSGQEDQLCPSNLSACPISGSVLSEDTFECVDLLADLKSCGGCDAKHDCTTIQGALSVACNVGNCVVHTCEAGYTPSADNTTCIQK